MTEKTVTVGEQEVTIRKTDDGFEVVDEGIDGIVGQFVEEVGYSEGDDLNNGYITEIREHRRDIVRVEVSDPTYDTMNELLRSAQDNGWFVSRVEFEYGQVDFTKED